MRQQAFIARVTHGLKTPLAGIQLMAESLQMGMTQDPKQANNLSRILVETSRLEKRIDEVLQVAKSKIKEKNSSMLKCSCLSFTMFGMIASKKLMEHYALSVPLEFHGDLELIRDAISIYSPMPLNIVIPSVLCDVFLPLKLRGFWVELSDQTMESVFRQLTAKESLSDLFASNQIIVDLLVVMGLGLLSLPKRLKLTKALSAVLMDLMVELVSHFAFRNNNQHRNDIVYIYERLA